MLNAAVDRRVRGWHYRATQENKTTSGG